jgi:hypothetical protein
MTNDEFEDLAEQFYNETGYLAPGKDWPAMRGGDPRGDYDTRLEKWTEWKAGRAAAAHCADQLRNEGRPDLAHPLEGLMKIAANKSDDPVLSNIEQGVRDGLAKAEANAE